ncbi:unnamed protein product [Clavelina lepadiformis]|uniref:Uncharacterized protein n=1 Tax=Clavelina lepadiformis TaxID=159417 RepID=A0ABP0FUN1_CLALP
MSLKSSDREARKRVIKSQIKAGKRSSRSFPLPLQEERKQGRTVTKTRPFGRSSKRGMNSNALAHQTQG